MTVIGTQIISKRNMINDNSHLTNGHILDMTSVHVRPLPHGLQIDYQSLSLVLGYWDIEFGCWSKSIMGQSKLTKTAVITPIFDKLGNWCWGEGTGEGNALIAEYFFRIPLAYRRLVGRSKQNQWYYLEAINNDTSFAYSLDNNTRENRSNCATQHVDLNSFTQRT